ncbi:MAG: type II toxin-antitoxin system RelE/ParE family toxin [Pirellulales bacterium]|nr:type II toxin-antitoxin system RelE/ParE family toxin [Pirellulales bacterium]
MSHVECTRRAEVDLRRIWVYVAERNFSAADRLWDQLQSAFNLLSMNQYMGEAIRGSAIGLRQFSVGSYVIFFRPLPNGIRLLRVVHASRDMRAVIEELDEGEQ